ncbi:hypothetical protein TRFO_23707 [Tritrichomonas foetus]|uniref:DUF3447 domain-containing protein n=1 Tax=Tritrichomonas foetus TaxID=1144522 RepID=A0A1J4KEI2_9EUKA|nr:hypothetical protein TRFO_23707 [Tritrichomonas foetus]|eukprot:OHT07998.1 hypothetical protein TRFO_23707 [Tritrichomonas foetus]
MLIRSPLYIAVIKNNLEIFNLLLFHSNFDINKEINTKSSFRTQNVLDYIIKNDLIEYFKIIMLIKNIQFDKSFEQLLCYYYSESKTEIIKFVVKSHKIYLEQNDNSLLGLACQQNDIDMVKFLLENGEINQNLNQMEQRYLVHRHDLINIACQNNNINLCQLLFADKRIIMNDELFPQSLKYACENKNIELIHLLLSRPNISKKSLLSSIKITCKYEFLEIAQNILKNFQITQEDLISLLPIQEENLLLFDLIIKNVSRQNIIQKKEIFVKSLLSSIDHGYSQKFIDIQINTIFDVITDVETIYSILLRACSNNMVDLVEKILYRKRFLYVSKTVGKYESFPLYTACQRGYLDIVKLLLKFPNININQRTRSLF